MLELSSSPEGRDEVLSNNASQASLNSSETLGCYLGFLDVEEAMTFSRRAVS